MSKPRSPISGSAPANRVAQGLASTPSAPPCRFAEAEGFEIVAEHVEIETGKGRMRSSAARNSPPPSLRPAVTEGRARRCLEAR